jgi:hypothetical protein
VVAPPVVPIRVVGVTGTMLASTLNLGQSRHVKGPTPIRRIDAPRLRFPTASCRAQRLATGAARRPGPTPTPVPDATLKAFCDKSDAGGWHFDDEPSPRRTKLRAQGHPKWRPAQARIDWCLARFGSRRLLPVPARDSTEGPPERLGLEHTVQVRFSRTVRMGTARGGLSEGLQRGIGARARDVLLSPVAA